MIIFNKTFQWFLLHIGAMIVCIASAVVAVGPTKLEGLFSHNPIQITISVCSLIVALGASFGIGACSDPSFLKR